jgi:Ca-activated chloride channel family protein
MPESTLRSGLFNRVNRSVDAAAGAVPLTGVSIDSEISGFCARVSVIQRYVNRESAPIEAVYVFPLDEGAAVCGFEAIIDGTLVVGEVKEREEAFRLYDDAMERGDGAYLLDEERPDVFQASVGNLPPGGEALLKLTYVTELAVRDSGLRFSIPTTVSPRYAPAEDLVGVGRPDSEALNPPLAWRVPYGLTLSVRVSMPGSISRIESPSHPVSVTLNGSEATIQLSCRDAALDRDFVVSVDAEGLDRPQAWIERDDEGACAAAVAFVPRLAEAATPVDIAFLVDRSGSMEGTSIEEVRNALQLCLRSLIAGCRFNVVGFGSNYESLFPENRAYDDASLAAASAHVGEMRANLGGTELLPALTHVLGQPRHPSLARQVVVLTDGQVTNTDAVLALARKHAADTRIFTFGIGAGASHHLVKGLARAGGGTAEFVFPGERIEPKVVRQVGRILSPALTKVSMNWGGLDVTQSPSVVPPIFAGGRLLLYAFVKNAAPATVRLTAEIPTGPVAFEVAMDPARSTAGRAVATLAARARIRELEESSEWTTARGSQQRDRKASRVTQEIIALSTRYGVISRETSFVAVERRDTPVEGEVQLRRVPIALTAGWGGVSVGPIWAAPAQLSAAPMPARAMHKRSTTFDTEGLAASAMSGAAAFLGALRGRHDEPPSESVSALRTPAPPAPPAMLTIAVLQRADGSWDLTRELAEAIGRDLRALDQAVASASGHRDDIRRAWATALALAWLREHARDHTDEWKPLAIKARRWLDDVPAVPPGGGAWVDAAAAFLRVP